MQIMEIPTGTLIKTIRTSRGMYQKKLAELANLPRTALVMIERNQVLPGQQHKNAIEAALSLHLDDPQVRAAFLILAGEHNGNE